MRLTHAPLVSLLTLTTASLQQPPPRSPARLWATHYSGSVYTLSFDGHDLSLTDTAKTCGAMPSWLTLDPETRTVYCSDEDGTADASTHGSLWAYHAGNDGKLHQVAKTNTVGGGVHSVIFEDGKGEKYLAIAHYGGSAISTFALPLRDNEPAVQEFHFNMTRPGAVAQQDSPHPHQVFLDPTGSFVVSPDLGADLLRVYSIDSGSGKLQQCPPVNITFGSGPRHGVFWTDGTSHHTYSGSQDGRPEHSRQIAAVGKTMMYLANEIGGTLDVFEVAYARSGCLSFHKTQTMVPYTNSTMPKGATPAEIRMVGDALYVSIRTDQAFAPNDSIVTLDRNPRTGAVRLRNKTSSYGKVPRTFAINRAGDLVAIGDQATSTVVIVRRDRATGNLGEKIAELQVGEPGKVGTSEGLSSVIWDE
ncbi:putative 6-phosphogluconolactonase [Penicillium rolfsii]|nr:putative 6-phosphogluconolactonase [Penicillium rolfsii]